MFTQETLLNEFNCSWEQIKVAMIESRVDYRKTSWNQEEYEKLLEYFTGNRLQLPPGEEGILAVMEANSIELTELSEVLAAAEATQTLEDLVVWAEELTKLRRQEQIKQAAHDQHEREKLETKQLSLAQRLEQAQNTTVDVDRLRKILALTVSSQNKAMAQWNKDSKEVPDFLSEALAKVQTLTSK